MTTTSGIGTLEAEEITIQLVEVRSSLNEVKDDVKAVLAQAKLTNGRVTALEQSNAVEQGVKAFQMKQRSGRSWLWPSTVSVSAVVLGSLLTHYLG